MNKILLWSGVCATGLILGYAGASSAFHRSSNYASTSIQDSYVLHSKRQRTIASRYFAVAAEHNNYQISAASLHRWLKNRPNSTVLIDVRQPIGPAGYSTGHISTARNIPLEVFWHELEAKRSETQFIRFEFDGVVHRIPIHFSPLPKNKRIVVMCYDGDGGEMIPALLRILGYKAYSLKYGTSMWNARINVWPSPGTVQALPTSSHRSEVKVRRRVAVNENDVVQSPESRAAIEAYLNSVNRSYPSGYARPWTIMAGTVHQLMHSKTPPLVVDVRSSRSFSRAHIPGSVNIPFRNLGAEIKTLPHNRQIVLVSQAMQSAAQATAVLRILGYKAFVLRQGLVSWNPTFKPPVPHHHYALVKST